MEGRAFLDDKNIIFLGCARERFQRLFLILGLSEKFERPVLETLSIGVGFNWRQ